MHHHRRRKKRPNYGNRIVDFARGINGFGFTISGQQPCILSCIVTNSPADLAGLRSGDFLISVNGMTVSKMPHEAVVQLISSIATIRMCIAENYYSDSSDEEPIVRNKNRQRPKYPHHKIKLNRNCGIVAATNGSRPSVKIVADSGEQMIAVSSRNNAADLSENSQSIAHNIIHSPNASNKKDIYNVSAMVCSGGSKSSNEIDPSVEDGAAGTATPVINQIPQPHQQAVEYRAVVGYLGTIEMPKQIATSSKLQTVRSCIRKMRQEKRNPAIVLMTIIPSCLMLRNSNNVLMAKYPTSRLNYVSSSSETDNRFFGLVTSAIYAADGQMFESAADIIPHRNDIVISNSCHVFVIDFKLTEHSQHLDKAGIFEITCTQDPISNLCLEFPNNSEYVVNIIRSMYTLKSSVSQSIGDRIARPHVARQLNMDGAAAIGRRNRDDEVVAAGGGGQMIANSPQPSNHSEITTTSSNSDSGIGFHNDCTNILDRILVVDFPVLQHRQLVNVRGNLRSSNNYHQQQQPSPPRPHAIVNEVLLPISSPSQSNRSDAIRNIRSTVDAVNESSSQPLHHKSKSLNLITESSALEPFDVPNPKLAVRVMGNTMTDKLQQQQCYENVSPNFRECAVDVPKRFELLDLLRDFQKPTTSMRSALAAARSCDDMMMSYNGRGIDGDYSNNATEPTTETKCHNKKSSSNNKKLQKSIDDISLMGLKTTLTIKSRRSCNNNNVPSDHHLFLPPKPVKRSKKPVKQNNSETTTSSDRLLSYKLSPKVFGVMRPSSASVEDLTVKSIKSSKRINDNVIWGSLQELRLMATGDNRTRSTFIDGTYSEPDIASRGLSNNSSPFKRWGQSSFRSRTNENRTASRRPSSLAASENDVYSKYINDGASEMSKSRSDLLTTSSNQNLRCGVTAWGTTFEKLLEDSAGLHTFAEFLKKEFSAENIYFWTSCERYRQLEYSDRIKEAIVIFSKHLAVGASEPVNVDSQARTVAQENLEIADRDLFCQAQKQIFNLMKFDSYQRFIRSNLYKSCLEAETKNQPLPYPGGDYLDVGLRTSIGSPSTLKKLKKSLSNAEDRRRKSLLPWHRKTRCKSKDRDEELHAAAADAIGTKQQSSNTLKTNSGSDIHSSRSSLSSFDAAISCRTSNQNDSDESKSSLCRVILTDGATTIVQTRVDESIRDLVERLLEKRGICYQAYEAFLAGTTKTLNLDGPSISLAGKEVLVEQRVVFKLDLPNRKVISVKSKPTKVLGEVLRPILHKYSYRLDLVQVLTKDSPDSLNMTLPVTTTDGQRLQIVYKPTGDWLGDVQQITVIGSQTTPAKNGKTLMPPPPIIITSSTTNSTITPVVSSTTPTEQPLPNYVNQIGSSMMASTFQNSIRPANNHQKSVAQVKLDEITNKVFNELMQGKVESHLHGINAGNSDHGGVGNGGERSTRSEEWSSDASSGIFGRLRRRDSNAPVNRYTNGIGGRTKKPCMQSKSSTAGSEDGTDACGVKKPLIAKLRAGVKLQVPGRADNHDFLEGLKRAQCSRLEDQRGTEINFELPDFLKDKENFKNNGNKHRRIKQQQIEPIPMARSTFDTNHSPLQRPQPAPRLSITKSATTCNIRSPITKDNVEKRLSPSIECPGENVDTAMIFEHQQSAPARSNVSKTDTNGNNVNCNENGCFDGGMISDINSSGRGPPPLPPKPKVLPMKPSNWGQQQNSNNNSLMPASSGGTGVNHSNELSRSTSNDKMLKNNFLDQSTNSGSFV